VGVEMDDENMEEKTASKILAKAQSKVRSSALCSPFKCINILGFLLMNPPS